MSIRSLCFALALGSATSGLAAPSFVPSPKQAFEGFVAINAPRAEVPVGALWIDGFGPTGEAASADNLETVRSVNGITIDKGLQLALTAGLFDLIGIEPRYRDRFTARFTDLAIVRVKDVSRLSGPQGEPRIIEAIKAASVIVSTDSDMGFNGRTLGWQSSDVEASTANGRTRNYAIEGRDLFIAFRVATPMLTRGAEQELRLVSTNNGEAVARIDDYGLTIRGGDCRPAAGTTCSPVTLGVTKLNSYSSGSPTNFVAVDERGEANLGLPVPTADDKGGLFDTMLIRWIVPCTVRKVDRCGRKPRLFAQYMGTRLEDLKSPNAKDW